MTDKLKGLIFYSKNIKDNDLFIKILSSKDEVNQGIVYGGNSSKKKLIYQKGYFIDYSIKKKNENFPPAISADISRPYLSKLIDDKYKLHALLSVLSLINISIVEGQIIKGFYNSVYKLIVIIINENRWIIYYCEWLFNLLQLIGYQIDYKKYVESKYYDLVNQNFLYEPNANTIEFPHNLFNNRKKISYKNLNAFFTIFENIFTKNHLDNMNYRMPIYFINFKKIILNTLQNL